jgi:hypothetical protein
LVRIALVIRVPQRSLKWVKDFVAPTVSAKLWRDFLAMTQVKQIAGVMAVVRVTKRNHQGDRQFSAPELDMVPLLADKPVRWVVEVPNTFNLVLVGKPPVVCFTCHHKGVFPRG